MGRLRLPAPSERTAGAAAVEFALLFPLFILIVFGTIDMGFAFNQKINLTQAAREGSRYGSTLGIKASHKTLTNLDGTIDTWLLNVATVVIDAGGSDLATSRANRYICVAMGGTTTKRIVYSGSSTTGTTSNSSCFDDGRTDDRVQVEVRSDTILNFILFSGTINVGSTNTTHYEVAI